MTDRDRDAFDRGQDPPFGHRDVALGMDRESEADGTATPTFASRRAWRGGEPTSISGGSPSTFGAIPDPHPLPPMVH